ncbi:MAG TPA: hypothetical protein VL944_00465 [Candidatus Acidoferrum sp.]|nr:hypothetical protein [Candidatus Acidoferrum sp.]
MITAFIISKIEGRLEPLADLRKQRFPRLDYAMDGVTVEGTKIKVNYEFSATYFDSDAKNAKSIGDLKLGGYVELEETKEVADKVSKKWADSKMLPPEMAEDVLNNLNFRCGATGTLVAYSLGLIPPLVITRTKVEEKKQ